jgi:hypothetical protein
MKGFIQSRFAHARTTSRADGPTDIYVKVYPDHLGDIPVAYFTLREAQTGVRAVVSGTSWCAPAVPIPDVGSGGTTPQGVRLTVITWHVARATGSVESVSVHHFYGAAVGSTGAADCCAGCGSGSGSGDRPITEELADGVPLRVTVPDGPNAGHYVAKPVGRLRWEVAIGPKKYEVGFADDGSGLFLRDPAASAAATWMDANPFAATLPGAVVGAKRDVVVTKA